MNLETGSSALESVEDNEIITPQRSGDFEETKIENNGSYVAVGEHEHEHVDDKLLDKAEGIDVGVMETVNSPPLIVRSPSPGGSIGSSPRAAMSKGYGLKKWKRIKRDFIRDESGNIDTSKILKRGLPNSAANSTKPQKSSIETKQKSEGSVSSTNAIVKNPGVTVDGFSIHGSNLDSRLETGLAFAAGTDSENSEDRSSKSSTAASVPKLRHEIPVMVGYSGNKNTMRSLSGKNSGNSVQRGQQGKGCIETSKKAKGERFKIEKENSHSSMESDSRSSNFLFVQGANSVTSNGRQSAKSINYDEESDDEAQGGEQQQFSEELQTGYEEGNVGDFENLSQEDTTANLSWEAKQEKSENHGSSSNRDPLVESILTLQSAEEALAKELEKLREIGMEQISHFDDSVTTNVLEASSSEQLHSGERGESSSGSLETQVISLKQNVDLLKSKIEEAGDMLKDKEGKVIELEANLESIKYREMDAELEDIFKQKIEAEIEYLAISRTIQKLGVAELDQITVFEEQKSLALEQARIMNQLGDAESKAVMLERQAEKLETYCEDIVEMDEVLKLQNRVFKITSYLFMQLILLFVVFVLFVLQLSPHDAGVVPT